MSPTTGSHLLADGVELIIDTSPRPSDNEYIDDYSFQDYLSRLGHIA